MKRITTILLCLLMAISLNVPSVFADDNPDLDINTIEWESPAELTWSAAIDAQGSYGISVFYSPTELSNEVLDSYWPGSGIEGAERLFHHSNMERYFPDGEGTCTYDFWELFERTGWYYAAVSGVDHDTENGLMHQGPPAIASLYYERPEKELIKPTGIDWSIDEIGDVFTKWDNMNQNEEFEKYYLEFAYISGGYTNVSAVASTIKNSIRVNEGWWYDNPNEYKFRVKAMPRATEWMTCAHSEWSEWSTFRSIGKEPRETLEDILNDTNFAPAQILDAIKNLNQEILKLDLQSKQECIDQYKKLEEKYAGEDIEVTINNDGSAVNPNKVSIVGAALNSGGADISLEFTKPSPEMTIDKSQMKNWIAFNMSLKGASYTGKLEVPVCITMPVPSGIAPSRLTIFHIQADGEIETIVPSISYNEIEGINYCTFILTSFSDFIFAELADGSSDDGSSDDGSSDDGSSDDDSSDDDTIDDDDKGGVVGGNNTNNNQNQANNKAGSPGTGDANNLLPSVLLIIFAMLCLSVTVYYRKKHRV